MGKLALAIRRVGSAAMVVSVLVACEDTKFPPNPSNIDRVCDTKCKRLVECNPAWDAARCQAGCRANKLRGYDRSDYIDASVKCLEAATCDVVLGPLDRKCLVETRPEPSDVARRYCRAAGAKDYECRGKPPDFDKCLQGSLAMISDTVLQKMVDCESLKCSSAGHCARETIGLPDY
jgi:hypothetical protein